MKFGGAPPGDGRGLVGWLLGRVVNLEKFTGSRVSLEVFHLDGYASLEDIGGYCVDYSERVATCCYLGNVFLNFVVLQHWGSFRLGYLVRSSLPYIYSVNLVEGGKQARIKDFLNFFRALDMPKPPAIIHRGFTG
nr:MAG TPA: hypothetical protein [Caudoviricetes sp.]